AHLAVALAAQLAVAAQSVQGTTAAATVLLDGRPVSSYIPATLEHGQVVGPVQPFITHLATSVEYAPPYLIVKRGATEARIMLRIDSSGSSGLNHVMSSAAPQVRSRDT